MENQKCLRWQRWEQRRWDKNPLTLACFFLLQFSENSEVTICNQVDSFHIITILLLSVKTLAGQEWEYLTPMICSIWGLEVRIKNLTSIGTKFFFQKQVKCYCKAYINIRVKQQCSILPNAKKPPSFWNWFRNFTHIYLIIKQDSMYLLNYSPFPPD